MNHLIQEYSVISTQCDFVTGCEDFVLIPGMVLPVCVDEMTYFHVFLSLQVSRDPCEVAIRLDENSILINGSWVGESQFDKVRMQMNFEMALPPGAHLLQALVRTLGGNPHFPEGPREWSPRKNKKSPKLSVVHCSPDSPAFLRIVG